MLAFVLVGDRDRDSTDRHKRAFDVVSCPQCEGPARKYADGSSFHDIPSFKIVCDANPKHLWRLVGSTPTARHK